MGGAAGLNIMTGSAS
jgi:hypothetical protein